MAKRKMIYSSPFEAEWAVLNHKAFLPHQRVTTEGKDMEQFAKVFESHDRQILVKKGEDSDGDPALCISTMISGLEMSINVNFSDDGDSLNKAFDSFTQDQADFFAKKLEGQTSPFEALKLLMSSEDV
ncbi:hypothetical protein MX032_16415 [Enterobacter cloacae subsp. cloacae]|uniref:hypothetical protein n=1 Tax=Enterobacter cloacae TaxID=550 RepID=UPI001FF6D03F|nr:hypothetical protein [Enterobacter cloacae]MCK1077494.1 hypothetical protein [Enterobacter cloacae subsp. cloacae]